MFKKLLVGFVAAAISLNLGAAPYVTGGDTKITQTSSYTNYGDGDVLFKVQNPIDECSHGYWLSKTDPGYEANVSMIIAAYQAKNTVLVYGLPDQLWAGSSGKYCKLYNIMLK